MSDTAVERTIAPKQLIALVKDSSEKREKIAEIAGALGERVKNACENGHLHRGAFALMVRMNKMEEQKRNDFLRSISLYADHCQTALWGGSHVGDIVDLAQARKDRDGDPQAVDDAIAESVKNAKGIKPLDPEKHEANQKGKRGRAKAAAHKAQAEDDDLDSAEAEGLADWHARKPGVIPEKYADKPAAGQRWLDGWERGQIQASKDRDAEDFDKNPPRAALPGADAPGTYVAH